jgi:hypothetical protein
LVDSVKPLIFLLVLANLIFYAFSAGHLGSSGANDAVRLEQQVSPESIRIVSRGEKPPQLAPSESVVTSPPLPEPVEPPVVTEPPVVSEAPPVPVCLAWAALAQVEAERVSRVVSRGFSEFKLQQVATNGEGNGWWVHIPPLADRAAADKKSGELRALGVNEYFIVQDGPGRNAISLGVFSNEKGARERLNQLQVQGVRSARLGVRPDKDGNVRLEVRGPADGREALLAAVLKAVPKSKPQDCQ